MAGRPGGPQSIVPANQMLTPAQMAAESWRLVTLAAELNTTESTLQWAARRRLVHNAVTCPRCARPATLVARADVTDGHHWRCARCRFTKSVRSGSFFERSHLSISSIVVIAYCWAVDMPQKLIAREADVQTKATIVDWCNFLREVAGDYIMRRPTEIGGFDNNGWPVVVEVDESKYYHRKYHRGQWRKGHWVFGGFERGTGKSFLVEVPDRTRRTLYRIIREHILPGSHIVHDGWRAYDTIHRIRRGIYTHQKIVHQRHFVDPNDPEVHTQNIENLWMRAKRKLRRQFGTSEPLFPSYLHEFLFREMTRDREVFSAVLECIRHSYPV